jgi:hypothetical protein
MTNHKSDIYHAGLEILEEGYRMNNQIFGTKSNGNCQKKKNYLALPVLLSFNHI